MTNDLICFDCLTEDNQQVPAVTVTNGTAICERCARQRAEALRAAASYVPPAPISGRPPEARIGGF